MQLPRSELYEEVARQGREVLRLFDPVARTRGHVHPAAQHRYDVARCRLARYTAMLNAEGRIADATEIT